ncbi:hypothetical protein Pyn_14616 [Prunus yedoensis var. nudiflora]|uniref:Uncharacterized protein n=1 Tax=Prunus yedoensis var. nudiflora TaxID=2094558 RepID=A0A314ZTV8_PRUYE|nr:hypothetical protein Pyn_14616 [Prunus yedoensis var. nudiflora]
MDEANSVLMMMEEGFASNQPSPMTESAPTVVTFEAQNVCFDGNCELKCMLETGQLLIKRKL